MRRILPLFFAFITACIPSGVYAEEVTTTFLFNGTEQSIEFSEGESVAINVSFSKDVYATRLFLCPTSVDECNQTSAVKYFSPNATTTTIAREWDGKDADENAVASGTYNVAVRFYHYETSADAIETSATHTIAFTGGDEGNEEPLLVTEVSGSLDEDAHWTLEQGVFVVQGVYIEPGVTVTIDPGVTVKLSGENALHIGAGATLSVGNVSGDPVIFTSLKDDEVSGDTNEDGDATSPSVGDWYGIVAYVGSTVVINNATFRYGGSESVCPHGDCERYSVIHNKGGDVSINGVTFSDFGKTGALFQTAGTATITDSAFERGGSMGVRAKDGSVVLRGSSFTDVLQGVHISGTSSITFGGNTFQDSLVFIETPFVNEAGNSGDGYIEISLFLQDAGAVSLPFDGIPYVPHMSLLGATTLTIDPGVIIKGPASSSVQEVFLIHDGAELVIGSSAPDADPVWMTSFKDDAVGGDTNNDGDASAPAVGDVRRFIKLSSGSTLRMENAVVRYGGEPYECSFGHCSPYALIFVDDSEAQINRVQFSDFDTAGAVLQMGDDSAVQISNSRAYGFPALRVKEGEASITTSAFIVDDPLGAAVINDSLLTVSALDNWWGDVSGPRHPTNPLGVGAVFSGAGDFETWLTEDTTPTITTPPPTVSETSYTRITPETYPTQNEKIIWTKKYSPYVIEGDVNIGRYGSLTVDRGVVVKFSTDASLTVHADVDVVIFGTEDDPVVFTSLRDDSVVGDTNEDEGATLPSPGDWGYVSFGAGAWNENMEIQYLTVRYGGGIERTDLARSFYPALEIFFQWYTHTPGREYTIEHIEVSHSAGVGLALTIGKNNSVTVENSSFHNNEEFGVYKVLSSKTFKGGDGTGNLTLSDIWWGSESGPYHSGLNPEGQGDAIGLGAEGGASNAILPTLNAWLSENPFPESASPQPQQDPEPDSLSECCSSVVFLPGLKGSVLKTGSDTLWPASILSIGVFNNDMLQLAVDPITGESVNDVFVDGVLENFYTTPIYSGFVSFMDSLVANTDDDINLNEWKALPYDWRFSPEKILDDGVITSSGTLNIIDEIKSLASTSPTGQVTIVSHSMGGLVGKEIIKRLEAEGNDSLIDSFVMVGTPQLGTPQAIASLLHGDGEGILGGFLVNASDVRKVAQNMQSAYNLLPSYKYFDVVGDPVIFFNEKAVFTKDWRNYWGLSLDAYLDFFSFVTGGGVARTEPAVHALKTPEVLNADLMNSANTLHSSLDNYDIPETIRLVQIAGWGVPTVKSIEYKNVHFLPSYKVNSTREGDGTVVYPSALSTEGERYYFNIFNYNENLTASITHRDILSASSIQNVIQNIIRKKSVTDINYISNTRFDTEEIGGQLIVRSNSPVILGVYDEDGNFTGIDPAQDLDSAVLFITEDIPGSSFVLSSNSQSIFLPTNGVYTFSYQSIGEGETTIEIGMFSNDAETITEMFSDILTTTTTSATFSVTPSESTTILVDYDTDGDIDETVISDEALATQQAQTEEVVTPTASVSGSGGGGGGPIWNFATPAVAVNIASNTPPQTSLNSSLETNAVEEDVIDSSTQVTQYHPKLQRNDLEQSVIDSDVNKETPKENTRTATQGQTATVIQSGWYDLFIKIVAYIVSVLNSFAFFIRSLF